MAAFYGETPLGLSSEIVNLAGVLTRRAKLKVPRYQRPYTWTEHEVRQLIQDFRRAHEREAHFYFIGQIVLVKNNRGELEISDGQQRLATLTMIIAYTRDRLPHRAAHYQGLIMSDDSEPRPRLELRDEDANFFRGYVQEPGKISEMAALDEMGVDSKDALCAAANTISMVLGTLDDATLDSLLSFIASSVTFNVVEADERGAAAGIFNAMNNTGLDLSAADNIKCDLIENSDLSDVEADAAARKWEELEISLGRADFSKLINLMPFLLTGEQLTSPGDLAEFRRQVDKSGGVHAFLFDKLPRYGDTLDEILDGKVEAGAASADVNRRLKLMMQLEEWQWMPAALVFLAEHRGNAERARKFFQALERFAFACELSVIDNRVREKRFAAAAKNCGDERVYLRGGVLDLSDAERLKFIERLNRSSKVDRQRRLLLIRVEAALPGGAVLTRRDDATVEHVLPKGAAPWWNDRFPDRGLRQDAANLIGNMVLITRRQNQAADNKPYPLKRKVYFETPGAPIYAITRDIESIAEWTYDAIGARHEELVRLLGLDWDLVRGA